MAFVRLRGRVVVVMLAAVATPVLAAQDATSQNSTRKIRPDPSERAAKAGSAVQWRASLQAAKEEALRDGKPVFWYVPTVPGSPMDRRPEIDRYMLAGPFSWPPIVHALNRRFVPVRAVPSASEAKQRELVRGKFIEPGFVVLAADGAETLRCDRITTHAPDWWLARLAQALRAPIEEARPPALAAALDAYGRDDFAVAEEKLAALAASGESEPGLAQYLRGVVLRRLRRWADAERAWDAAVAAAPDHMLAWKIAAEREGHGPFLRAFEDYRPLPAAVVAGATHSSQAPGGVYTRAEVVARSLRFLLEQQDEDGLYRDSTYDFGGTDSLPNVHMAVTALVGCALLEARGKAPASLRAGIDTALARIDRVARDETRIAEHDRDEIAWAHAYRLRLLCRWMQEGAEARSRAFAKASELAGALADLQEESGAWFHEYPNPFVMATVLLSLHEAKRHGVAVPEDVAVRGAEALLRCRAQNGAFPYGFARRPPARVQVVGAAGRMPLCELALLRWGKSDPAKLAAALEVAFEHHAVLAAVRKYDDHADQHGYGGFFFWYDMQARSEAIEALEDGELRARYRARQDEIVLSLPEVDGCFVDSHELGRCYGTAMALLCLRGE